MPSHCSSQILLSPGIPSQRVRLYSPPPPPRVLLGLRRCTLV
ncbi:hypothetical protein CUP1273 [Campylobacter upsaliensis RM3195]|nr:hypothetical protein CUP1273 [Campylobacter upsaliensis RM3195]